MKRIYLLILMFVVGFWFYNNKLSAENPQHPNVLFTYNSSGNGMFWVYVNVKDSLYAGFKINHEVNEKQNKNLWRVMDSYFSIYKNGAMSHSIQILTPGENEFVWLAHRPEVVEFTGGFHGNERIDSDDSTFAKFYADGEEIDTSMSYNLVECNTFYYRQKSYMFETGTGGTITSPNYKPVENAPVECIHEKKTTFGDGGYQTYNKVVWRDNSTPIKRMYYGIFCVTGDVSKNGYNDTGETEPVIIPLIDDGAFKLKSPEQRVVMFNDDSKISVVCDAEVISGGPFQLSTSIWDHRFYHKYYTAIDNGAPIITEFDEVWETNASIKFNVYKNDNYTSVAQLRPGQNGKDNIKVIYENDGGFTIHNINENILLYDIHGKLVFSKKPTSSSTLKFQLKEKGVYFIKTKNGTVKIIV